MVKNCKYTNIRKKMAEKKETVDDLAELLGISGQTTYFKLIGKTQFKVDEAKKLCRHYKMKFEPLFREEED